MSLEKTSLKYLVDGLREFHRTGIYSDGSIFVRAADAICELVGEAHLQSSGIAEHEYIDAFQKLNSYIQGLEGRLQKDRPECIIALFVKYIK